MHLRAVARKLDGEALENEIAMQETVDEVNVVRKERHENRTKSELRKQAMERLLKRQDAMPFSRWTDDELDRMQQECLKGKHG
jgi:hypothetical protein